MMVRTVCTPIYGPQRRVCGEILYFLILLYIYIHVMYNNNRARGTRGPRPTTIKKITAVHCEGRTRKCITSYIILYTFYNTCRIIIGIVLLRCFTYTWQTSSPNIVCASSQLLSSSWSLLLYYY